MSAARFPQDWQCPECGEPIYGDVDECPECGERFKP